MRFWRTVVRRSLAKQAQDKSWLAGLDRSKSEERRPGQSGLMTVLIARSIGEHDDESDGID